MAKLGSFTNAPEVLQVGRPHVTRYIQELEATLGGRLFQRTTRSVKLTTEGEQFYARAAEILVGIEEATTMLTLAGKTLRGRLRVDIPAALAQQRFVDRLRVFNRLHPSIELVPGVSDRAVDLVTEGVDCVLRFTPPMSSWRTPRSPLLLIATRASLRAHALNYSSAWCRTSDPSPACTSICLPPAQYSETATPISSTTTCGHPPFEQATAIYCKERAVACRLLTALHAMPRFDARRSQP